jgi:hypothetical protein
MKFFLFSLYLPFLVLFTPSTMALEGYCFSRGTSLSRVSSHVQVILAPKDKVYKRDSLNCIELEISASRKDLVEKWIRKKFRVLKTYTDAPSLGNNNAQPITANCRLKIERVSQGKSQVNRTRLGSRNSVTQTNSSLNGVRTSNVVLGLGFSGSIRVNEEQVSLTCKSIINGGYLVSVSIDSESSGLVTTLQVYRGKKVNLGQVVNTLNSKTNTIGIPSGLDNSKSKSKETFDYFLTTN